MMRCYYILVVIVLLQYSQTISSLRTTKPNRNHASDLLKHGKQGKRIKSQEITSDGQQLFVAKSGIAGIATSLSVLLAPLAATAAAGVPVGDIVKLW